MDTTTRWLRAQISTDLKTLSSETVDVKIASGKYGFNHEMFDKLRRRQYDQDEYVANPYEAEEGIVQCGKCKSKRVYSYSVQTRSADEPMSTRSHCTSCGFEWTSNS